MSIDERLIFFKGKHVVLKVLSEQDILESNWVGWFNDDELSVYNLHHYFPNTYANQREHLKDCVSPSKLQLGIVDQSKSDNICGLVSLSNIDLIHRNAEIAGIMDLKYSKTNPALFIESWSIMIKHGFEELGLHKIYGGSFHPQVVEALIRLFNFEREGVQKSHVYKRNAYHDIELIAVFNDTISYPEL